MQIIRMGLPTRVQIHRISKFSPTTQSKPVLFFLAHLQPTVYFIFESEVVWYAINCKCRSLKTQRVH